MRSTVIFLKYIIPTTIKIPGVRTGLLIIFKLCRLLELSVERPTEGIKQKIITVIKQFFQQGMVIFWWVR